MEIVSSLVLCVNQPPQHEALLIPQPLSFIRAKMNVGKVEDRSTDVTNLLEEGAGVGKEVSQNPLGR